MDEQLKALMERNSTDETGQVTIGIVDEFAGVVEVLRNEDDASLLRHTLKPLAELYGRGTPGQRVDPQSGPFMPLFFTIEETIVKYDHDDSSLTDGQVMLVLDKLGMSPECDVRDDRLARRIQVNLRANLSLNDYSRDEVRQAIRKIRKSVDRHTRLGGRRGYLDFIREYLRV